MENNPFEVKSRKKKTNRSFKQDVDSHHNGLMQDHKQFETEEYPQFIKSIIKILDYTQEHMWAVIVVAAIFADEFSAPIILIAIFSKQIKKQIIDYYHK